jgi:hypothetical protein
VRRFLVSLVEPGVILYSKEDGNVKAIWYCFDCFDYAISKKNRERIKNMDRRDQPRLKKIA